MMRWSTSASSCREASSAGSGSTTPSRVTSSQPREFLARPVTTTAWRAAAGIWARVFGPRPGRWSGAASTDIRG